MPNDVPLEEILLFARQLMTIRSISTAVEGLHEALSAASDQVEKFAIEPFLSNDIPSILVHNQKPGTMQFKVLMTAHLDVVPGADNQFDPYIEGGRLYGRGAYDMKAAAAVMIILFRDIAKQVPYPLALQIVTDEEAGGSNGMKVQVDKGLRTEFAIAGESGSNFRIVNQAKGILRMKICASGKAYHSAYPWFGENAILKLNKAINAIIQKYPMPEQEVHETTVNITNINNGNDIHTMTPDHCEAILDIRFVPQDKHFIYKSILDLLPEGVTAEVLLDSPAVDTDKNDPYVVQLKEITHAQLNIPAVLSSAHGTSDLRYLSQFNIPGVEFGPVGDSPHSDQEWVDIQSLADYYAILRKFLFSIH